MKSTFAIAAVTLLVFVTGACVTEETPSNTGEIRFRNADAKYKVMRYHAIFRGEERLGTLEHTLHIDGDSDDSNDRFSWVVRDQNNDMVGYVTDDSRAYRLRAHGQKSELVANQTSLEGNVMSVLGFFEGKIRLVDLTATNPGE